jgi:hypothetical protein
LPVVRTGPRSPLRMTFFIARDGALARTENH